MHPKLNWMSSCLRSKRMVEFESPRVCHFMIEMLPTVGEGFVELLKLRKDKTSVKLLFQKNLKICNDQLMTCESCLYKNEIKSLPSFIYSGSSRIKTSIKLTKSDIEPINTFEMERVESLTNNICDLWNISFQLNSFFSEMCGTLYAKYFLWHKRLVDLVLYVDTDGGVRQDELIKLIADKKIKNGLFDILHFVRCLYNDFQFYQLHPFLFYKINFIRVLKAWKRRKNLLISIHNNLYGYYNYENDFKCVWSDYNHYIKKI